MSTNRWYNKAMSKITSNNKNDDNNSEGEFQLPAESRQIEHRQKEINSELDINLVISSFQEKVGQLTTEIIIKDATIKQLTAIINTMRGQRQ